MIGLHCLGGPGFSSRSVNIKFQILIRKLNSMAKWTRNCWHVLKPETTKRNHRNETTETSEMTETKRAKPPKRPKRLFVSVVSFRSFRWFRSFRFARFGRFGGFVLVVSLVSVVSFRWFCFVVSGFSTCRNCCLRIWHFRRIKP